MESTAAAVATNIMARRGIEPALAATYLVIIVETIGAICITLGLFTRPVAVLLVGEFITIALGDLARGWMASGAELSVLWLIVFVYILTRGGGPYSLDSTLGREI